MAKKDNQMMVRLDDEAHQTMQRLSRDTQLAAAALARAAVLTMLASYQRHGRIEFPLGYWEPDLGAEAGLGPKARMVAEDKGANAYTAGDLTRDASKILKGAANQAMPAAPTRVRRK